MPYVCPSCGEQAVEKASCSTEESDVCTSCGVVVETCQLDFSSAAEGSSHVVLGSNVELNLKNVPSYIARCGKKRILQSQKEAFDKISDMASHFHMNADMKHEAKQTYLRLMDEQLFRKMHSKNKTALIGCCCMIVMRQRQWPTPMKTISGFLQCSTSDIFQVYQKVKKVIKFETSYVPTEELVQVVLKEMTLSDKEAVEKRTKYLLDLASTCWFTEGKSRFNVIKSIVFIAWKSLDINRTKVDFKKFCSIVGTGFCAQTRKCVTSFIEILVKIAENIPWLKKVDKSKISVYVPVILKYSGSLVDACTSDMESEISPSEQDVKDYKTFRFKNCKSSVSDLDAMCNDTDDVNGDSDFSDSEIDKYIRSEKEVIALKKFLDTQAEKD